MRIVGSRGLAALGVGSSLALASALASGCASAHRPIEIESGIYELSIMPELDGCRPARGAGVMGRVAVVASDDVVNVGLVDGSRVSLARASGMRGVEERRVEGCADAVVRRTWAVMAGSELGFTLDYSEEWRGLETCTAVAFPEAPEGDCRASLVLDYTRMQTCRAPCDLSIAATGPTCLCP